MTKYFPKWRRFFRIAASAGAGETLQREKIRHPILGMKKKVVYLNLNMKQTTQKMESKSLNRQEFQSVEPITQMSLEEYKQKAIDYL